MASSRAGRTLSRRLFLRRAGAASVAGLAFPAIVPASARGGAGRVAPSDRIGVALVGSGPQGQAVMKGFLAEEAARVVAVCDAKADQRQEAGALVDAHYQDRSCASHADFREVLARPDVDAVIVATPDHWHVLMALAAVRAGKDVYLEKPMSPSVAEDQALRAAVRETGRVFQFGTQQRSGAFFRRACEIVRNGRIGRLQHDQRVVHRERARRVHRRGPGAPGLRLRPLARARRRGSPTGRTSARTTAPGRPGGSTPTTRWASSPAGASTRWTSPTGATRR
jgi:threonine dehydrogenase-like Zn-dependent dehydrogenase